MKYLLSLIFTFSLVFSQDDYSSWLNHKDISVSGYQVDISDYPLQLNIVRESSMSQDLSDLRFSDNDGNSLSYFIESSGDSWINAWVRLGVVSSDSYVIRLYYGNDTAQSESNPQNVFSNPNVSINFLSTPTFYKTNLTKQYYNKVPTEANFGEPIEGGLNNKFRNKDNYGVWLYKYNKYYCEDMGCKWRDECNIKPSVIHTCGRYKICIYCGKTNYKLFPKIYKCSICSNKGYGLVICSQECYNQHIQHLNSEV